MLERKAIGKRIRAVFPGKTQEEIGKALDVSQRLVSDWVRGRVFPRLTELEKVVAISGCTWDWLLTGKETYPAEALSGRTLTHVQLGVMQGSVRQMMGELESLKDAGHRVNSCAESLSRILQITNGEDADSRVLEHINDPKAH